MMESCQEPFAPSLGQRLETYRRALPEKRPDAAAMSAWGAQLAGALLSRAPSENELGDAGALYDAMQDEACDARAARMLCGCACDMARGVWPGARLEAGFRALSVPCSAEPAARDGLPVLRVLPSSAAYAAPSRMLCWPLDRGQLICMDVPPEAVSVKLYCGANREPLEVPPALCARGFVVDEPPQGAQCVRARAVYEQGESEETECPLRPSMPDVAFGVCLGAWWIPLPRALAGRLWFCRLTVRVRCEGGVPPLCAVFGEGGTPLAPGAGRELAVQGARTGRSLLRLPRLTSRGDVSLFTQEEGGARLIGLLRVTPHGVRGGAR